MFGHDSASQGIGRTRQADVELKEIDEFTTDKTQCHICRHQLTSKDGLIDHMKYQHYFTLLPRNAGSSSRNAKQPLQIREGAKNSFVVLQLAYGRSLKRLFCLCQSSAIAAFQLC